MADDVFASVAGFIQFDIDEREYNDGVIRDVTIRTLSGGDGTGGQLLRISVWPDMDIELERGDYIVVDGKVSFRDVEKEDGSTVTYTNMNARRIARFDTIGGAAPAVVKKDAAATERKTF